MRPSGAFAHIEPQRRVLSRSEALALGRRLLGLVRDQTFGVEIAHTVRAVTKVTNGAVLNTDDGDRVWIRFRSQFGSGLPVSVSTNQLNETTLQRVVARALAMAPPNSKDQRAEPDDPDDEQYFTYNARELPSVSLWHDTTIQAMDTARGTTIPQLVEQVRGSQLTGVATVGLAARSVLYLYAQGLTAFAEETDCEVTMTARTPDNLASGWAGQADRDWAQLTPNAVVAQAIELADRSRNSAALEPGRRMAILGPAAVAQLVYQMAPLFDADATNAVGGHGTPFTVLNYDRSGRHTKLGLRVFDPRITMISDPADPAGGFPPFFELGGVELFLHGYPTPAVTWIDRGVLTHLAYNASASVGRHLTPCDWPRSVRFMAAPGVTTATIDEMIANCQEGIYVNRFSDVSLLDRETGMMTGVTRDGCFLIKHGKIAKPIKNFRFTESPFFGFNKLEMIGAPERVAFGYNAPPGGGESWLRWPRLPVIVPPLMIRDFNFSALASAV